MSNSNICCKDLANFSNIDTPFVEGIVLGYYDGPTAGILRCGRCSDGYQFAMIDYEDNPEGSDWRIFRFSPIPRVLTQELFKALPRVKNSSDWKSFHSQVPRWRFLSELNHETTSRQIYERIRVSVEEPAMIVLSNDYWIRTVIKSKHAEKEDIRRQAAEDIINIGHTMNPIKRIKQSHDWFSFIGLQRESLG